MRARAWIYSTNGSDAIPRRKLESGRWLRGIMHCHRNLGSALAGELGGLWRWRIGDYRVVARIEDERITILIVRVAHRREVYR